MTEHLQNINEAERGGLIDLGKILRKLLGGAGGGGGPGGSVSPATTAEFRAGLVTDKYISPAVFFAGNAAYTLTDDAPVIVNMALGKNFLLTFAEDRIVSNPINATPGQDGIFIVQQGAVGGKTLTWEANYKFSSGAPILPQSPHAWTVIRYFVETINSIRCTVEGQGGTSLGAATVQELWLGLETLKYVSPSVLIASEVPALLLEEDPVFVDLGEAKNFELILSASREIGQPLDQRPGRTGTITIMQAGAGTHEVTWHADWRALDTEVHYVRKGAGAITVFRYRVLDVGNVRISKEPVLASTSEIWTGDIEDHYLSPKQTFDALGDIVLAYSPTVTPNLNTGLIFSLTLQGSCQIANPTGQRRGKSGRFHIQQDASGGYAVTWGTDFQFVGGIAPVVPTVPFGWTIVPYEVKAPGLIIASSVEALSGGGGEAVPSASVAEIKAASAVSKYIAPSGFHSFFSPTILTDAATVTPDLDLGPNFVLTIEDNRTIANITHQRPGLSGFITIIQGAAGGKTVTWGANYTFLGGVPAVPATPGQWVTVPYHIQTFGVIRCITIQLNVIPAAASVAEVWAGTVANKYIPPLVAVQANAFVTLADAATIAVDLQTGRNFKAVIGGDRAFANPTNQVAGQGGLIKVQQDPTGGRTASWGNEYIFESTPPVIPTDPNKHLVLAYQVESPGVVLMGH